jgi:hypothetical protein
MHLVVYLCDKHTSSLADVQHSTLGAETSAGMLHRIQIFVSDTLITSNIFKNNRINNRIFHSERPFQGQRFLDQKYRYRKDAIYAQKKRREP